MEFANPRMLTELVDDLPTDLVSVRGRGDLDRTVSGVVITDPDGPAADASDVVLLAVGWPARKVADLIAAAGRAGCAGVAVRTGTAATSSTRLAAAEKAGVVLLELARGRGWSELQAALLGGRDATVGPASGAGAAVDDELSSLAQTTANLSGGMVTIEDARARVLAYSTSTDEVDELRRLSILGRSGPPAYLDLLREWGVYDRLATSEEVVEIAEHPESGVRARLAVGIFAGGEQLGTIWVQQGAEAFPHRARHVLLGAARIAATAIVSRRSRFGPAGDGGLSALLNGRVNTLESVGARLGRMPCVVAALAFDGGHDDPAHRSAQLDAAAGIARVHAAALRGAALSTAIDGRLYLLLPDVAAAHVPLPMLRAAASAAARHLTTPVRAALGPVVPGVAEAVASRAGADLVLAGLEPPERDEPSFAVATFEDVRPGMLVAVSAQAAATRADLHDPDLARLCAGEPVLAHTLHCYLDAGSDVGAAAERLGVHPTTVRYRLRRIGELTDLQLADPDARLAAHLQLRAAHLSPSAHHLSPSAHEGE